MINHAEQQLLDFIVPRVRDWINERDQKYAERWEEYYRLWRGFNSEEELAIAGSKQPRSVIISPALAEAIENFASELEESSIGRGDFFDIADNFMDQAPEDMVLLRNMLREDLYKEGITDKLAETILAAAIWGTGILKIVVEEASERRIDQELGFGATESTRIAVKTALILPHEFAIDPVADDIESALGCAHCTSVTKHSVEQKMIAGIYKAVDVGSYVNNLNNLDPTDDDIKLASDEDKVFIVEYHGLVPEELLDAYQYQLEVAEKQDELSDLAIPEEQPSEVATSLYDPTRMVEAIITIANGKTILRAVRNPFWMKDRSIVHFVVEKVPGEFWGRGISEKGFQSAKALDAEMRGRIDAMRRSIFGAVGINALSLPHGVGKPTIGPNSVLLFNGDPAQAMKEIKLSSVGAETFNQSAELRQMLQAATGTLDMTRQQGYANEKVGVVSMAHGSMSKRMNRSLANLERQLLTPLVHKIAWRYMQFDTDRYPVIDVDFVVETRLSVMSRELQQQQFAQLLNSVPQESPAYWLLLRGVFEYSQLPNRENILKLVDQMVQASLQAQQVQQIDPAFQLQAQKIQHDMKMDEEKLKLEQIKVKGDLEVKADKLQLEQRNMLLDASLKEKEIAQDAYTSQLQAKAQLSAIMLKGQNK